MKKKIKKIFGKKDLTSIDVNLRQFTSIDVNLPVNLRQLTSIDVNVTTKILLL
jgi:hypothetical protein